MNGNILIPIDFSPASVNALDYAVEWAQKTRRNLLLFHSNNLPDSDPLSPAYYHHKSGVVETEYHKVISDNMRELMKRVTDKTNNEVAVDYLSEIGSPVSTMITSSKENSVEMIIVGLANEHKDEDYYSITNIVDLIQQSDLPILIVPETYNFKKVSKIIFAVDAEEDNVESMRVIKDIASDFNASITVLHIDDNGGEDKKAMESLRNSIASDIDYSKILFETHKDDDVVDGIKKYNASSVHELLVMRKHRRNFIERIFESSRTKQMAVETEIPLLIYH